MTPFAIGADRLDLPAFLSVCRGERGALLAPAAREAVVRGLEFRRALADGAEAVYGVNTGFGKLADTRIDSHRLGELQVNLVRSHAVGWGRPLTREEARGMVLLRAASLAQGHSGVRPEVVEQLLWLLDADVHPFLPSRGSVGASGDLAPLAHLALVLMGEGHVLQADGARVPAGPVLAAAGRAPLVLEAKEGLALINGTQMMNSLGLLGLHRADRLVRWAVLALGLTLEALEASRRPFGEAFHALRPHPGPVAVAACVRRALDGSDIMEAHQGCGRIQDPYSVRCAAQVLGASLEELDACAATFLREAASVTDNPILFPETGEAISGGHFHGQPLALRLDALRLAAAEAASVAERRIDQLMNGNGGRLPRFLAAVPGLESGLMIAQYLAAALVSESKQAAFPASADSIPTSLGQEDHVSMGSVAALALEPTLARSEAVIALEMLTAARALQFVTRPELAASQGRDAHAPSRHTARLLEALADRVELEPGDRPLTLDLEALLAWMADADLTAWDDVLAPLAATREGGSR
ncbi:MAG TPA: histidine ammonia-lyase [Candidatus Krumholzibacteria bacterium]|nr:histidine ammonia-lyase [Candidatus Krumholzibacteria bacterium]HRX50668.1 histidine ammonia-lyase [Candidatus Krumholzibacteria bacterium]